MYHVTSTSGKTWRCSTVKEEGNFLVMNKGKSNEVKLQMNSVETVDASKGSGLVGLVVAGLIVAAIK